MLSHSLPGRSCISIVRAKPMSSVSPTELCAVMTAPNATSPPGQGPIWKDFCKWQQRRAGSAGIDVIRSALFISQIAHVRKGRANVFVTRGGWLLHVSQPLTHPSILRAFSTAELQQVLSLVRSTARKFRECWIQFLSLIRSMPEHRATLAKKIENVRPSFLAFTSLEAPNDFSVARCNWVSKRRASRPHQYLDCPLPL